MITSAHTQQEIEAWFSGRLPAEWTTTPPDLSVDREEIIVRLHVTAPEQTEDAAPSVVAESVAGRISGWREETREARMAIAQEAERRFGRKVSWGVVVGEQRALFTHIAVPVMTRLRQPERLVLDTLVEAGVARSRSEALQWCVKLVGTHSEEWLSDLRSAMDHVHAVREQGPAA